jgi:hypothetical protein
MGEVSTLLLRQAKARGAFFSEGESAARVYLGDITSSNSRGIAVGRNRHVEGTRPAGGLSRGASTSSR